MASKESGVRKLPRCSAAPARLIVDRLDWSYVICLLSYKADVSGQRFTGIAPPRPMRPNAVTAPPLRPIPLLALVSIRIIISGNLKAITMRRTYIALVHKEPDSDGVSFPNLSGCITAGRILEETREVVAEALALHLLPEHNRGSGVALMPSICCYIPLWRRIFHETALRRLYCGDRVRRLCG